MAKKIFMVKQILISEQHTKLHCYLIFICVFHSRVLFGYGKKALFLGAKIFGENQKLC